MTTGNTEALLLTLAMASVIFFCRFFPFLFFREKSGGKTDNSNSDNSRIAGKRKIAFLNFVEKTVPPAAMTVLAFNALSSPIRTNPCEIIPALAAAILTAAVHLWKRNPLISIFTGTAVFMILQRVMG